MDSCCNLKYQSTFDDARAEKEMKNYLSAGVKKDSRLFIKALQQLPLDGRTLLDIGSGIGTVIFESFDRGLAKATYVDLSAAYRKQFLEEVHKRDLMEQVDAKQGDLTDLHEELDLVDLVTLDKVICCYENFHELVRQSVGKARRWYVYSIPREVWWVRLVHRIEALINKIRGNNFRTFIHPSREIEALVRSAGFTQVARRRQREWEVTVFEKTLPKNRN